VPGHWEGDLIVGLNRSAIGTLVERTSRFTLLLHLPRMDDMDDHAGPRVKNGPPLAGHGAAAVRDAIAASMLPLPDQLRRSLTWDQGAEMAQHAQLRLDTGLRVYFCDPLCSAKINGIWHVRGDAGQLIRSHEGHVAAGVRSQRGRTFVSSAS
jgi:IS30 family transposase